MAAERKITPCLWFDTEAEEAARFYVSVFRNARIGGISRYGKEGFEIHDRPEGSVMTVEFDIEGQGFVALNGARNSASVKRCPSRCTARRRPTSTISGTGCPRVARRARAAG